MAIETNRRRPAVQSITPRLLLEGAISSPYISLEQMLLARTGAPSLGMIPKGDFIVTKSVIVIDALDLRSASGARLSLKDRKSILTGFLWADTGNFDLVDKYIEETTNSSRVSLMSPIMEEGNPVAVAYDQAYFFNEFMGEFLGPRLTDPDKLKMIARHILRLRGEGLSDSEIIAQRENILKLFPRKKKKTAQEVEAEEQRVRDATTIARVQNLALKKMDELILERDMSQPYRITTGVGAQVLGGQSQREIGNAYEPGGPMTARKPISEKAVSGQNYEEEFFLAHPEALEVLELKLLNLSHGEISVRLGRSIAQVHRLSRALIFWGRIEPVSSQAAKVEKYDIFLRQLAELRNKHKLGNQEAAERLQTSVGNVVDGAKFLIWMGLIKPLDKGEVLIKKSNRKQRLSQLANFLDAFPPNDLVNLRKKFGEFCIKYGLKMGYDTFLSLYHELEAGRSVPPSKATSRERIRERMIAEIGRIRATRRVVRINVKELCDSLGIDLSAGEIVFNTIEDTGPSNTKKGRLLGRENAIAILTTLANAGEIASLKTVAQQAGIGYNMTRGIYREMESGGMIVPAIRKRKQSENIYFPVSSVILVADKS